MTARRLRRDGGDDPLRKPPRTRVSRWRSGNARQTRCSKAREALDMCTGSLPTGERRRRPRARDECRRRPSPWAGGGCVSRLSRSSAATSIGSRYSASRSTVRPRAVADPRAIDTPPGIRARKTKTGDSSARRAKNSSSGVLMSGLNCRRLTSPCGWRRLTSRYCSARRRLPGSQADRRQADRARTAA